MMLCPDISRLYEGRKNFVFLGEAGSGKTEIALNFARALAGEGAREVHLFDLDQSKPLFRAREHAGLFDGERLFLHWQEQLLDAPIVASGLEKEVKARGSCTLLDVGGGYYGTHMIGQFSELLSDEKTEVIYIVNPFRPWSQSREETEATMGHILASSGLYISSYIANPHMMDETSADDVLWGLERVRLLLPEAEIKLLTVQTGLAEEAAAKAAVSVFPLSLYMREAWAHGTNETRS